MTRKGNGTRGCPWRSDQVIWKVIEERGILLNLEDGAYFEVNPVGLAVWQGCDGKREPEEIAQTVSRDFGVSTERAHQDVQPFLAELRRRRLIRFC